MAAAIAFQEKNMKIFLVGEFSAPVAAWLKKSFAMLKYQPTFLSWQMAFENTQQHSGGVFILQLGTNAEQHLPKLREQIPFLWIGISERNTPADHKFGLDWNAYQILIPSGDPSHLSKKLQELSTAWDVRMQTERLFRGLKSQLIGSNQIPQTVAQELKNAVIKLEHSVRQTDRTFFPKQNEGQDSTNVIPFYQKQKFSEVLLTVHEFQKTGILKAVEPHTKQEGFVEFLQGSVVSSKVGQVRGVKALHRIFLWTDCRFSFRRIDPDQLHWDSDIPNDIFGLCKKGEEHAMRYQKFSSEIAPNGIQLRLNVAALGPKVELTPQAFSALSSIVEFGNVKDVLDYNPLPDVELHESLILLRKQNLVLASRTK